MNSFNYVSVLIATLCCTFNYVSVLIATLCCTTLLYYTVLYSQFIILVLGLSAYQDSFSCVQLHVGVSTFCLPLHFTEAGYRSFTVWLTQELTARFDQES